MGSLDTDAIAGPADTAAGAGDDATGGAASATETSGGDTGVGAEDAVTGGLSFAFTATTTMTPVRQRSTTPPPIAAISPPRFEATLGLGPYVRAIDEPVTRSGADW